VEAPRGTLGHWIQAEGGRIRNYQIITPTGWNLSPRDSQDQPGPLESALVGTPVPDPERPVEMSHVVKSFDPCLFCTVH
jgi:hydrogenase large subunit